MSNVDAIAWKPDAVREFRWGSLNFDDERLTGEAALFQVLGREDHIPFSHVRLLRF
ncbi:hypothetical protein CDS [Bradyrhizobium sp.]|nr:hypothetical protein CDS [Bradyrhizobium sp.]